MKGYAIRPKLARRCQAKSLAHRPTICEPSIRRGRRRHRLPSCANLDLINGLSGLAVNVHLHPMEYMVAAKRRALDGPSPRLGGLDGFMGAIDAHEDLIVIRSTGSNLGNQQIRFAVDKRHRRPCRHALEMSI